MLYLAQQLSVTKSRRRRRYSINPENARVEAYALESTSRGVDVRREVKEWKAGGRGGRFKGEDIRDLVIEETQ